MKRLGIVVLMLIGGVLLSACGNGGYEEVTEVQDGVPVYIKISDGYVGYEEAYEEFNESAKEQIEMQVEEGSIDNGLIATLVMPTPADINQHQITVYYKPDTLERVDWSVMNEVVDVADARFGTAPFIDQRELFTPKSASNDESVPDVYFNYTGAEYNGE